MLARTADAPFSDDEWLYEVKWDGYRAIAETDNHSVALYSRHFQPFEKKFPSIANALRTQAPSAVLDGEIVAVDSQGIPRFQLLQEYARTYQGTVQYRVFDVLREAGRDMTTLPLIERKKTLAHIGRSFRAPLAIGEHVVGKGIEFYQAVCAMGLEGVMAKRCGSAYQSGIRSRDWLKIRAIKRREAIICGFTEGRGSREYFGSLVLGAHRNGKLTHIGNVGTGFSETGRAVLAERLQMLRRPTSPLAGGMPLRGVVHWVEPMLVCEVSFTEQTREGRLRHPVFVGLREDKMPQEIVFEDEPLFEFMPIRTERLAAKNRDKIFWPEEKYTKGDVLDYYAAAADLLLPHLRGRPQNLFRQPDGIDGVAFWQKDISDGMRHLVPSVRIRSEGEHRDIAYAIIRDTASLLALVDAGCIELHPWHSRVGSLDRPDYCLIDLDPLDIAFSAVIDVAQCAYELFSRLGISAWCKTSGATGLHICIPLGARYSYQQSLLFAKIIAFTLHRRLPSITSTLRNPRARKGRVYLDALQNRFGQTMAAPYCIRSRPGAPVSMPLRWSEVLPRLDPGAFTLRTAPDRMRRMGDLWRGMQGSRLSMESALAALKEESERR